MFPESSQLHHPLSHSHGNHGHYLMQQLSPGDFRPRASSNASSIGRLSPIPAVPESDVQDSPWSPKDYSSGGMTDVYDQPGTSCNSDRFNPDQLVDNIAESMKIRENGFLAPTSSSTSSTNGSVNSQPRQQQFSSAPSPGNNGSSINGYGLCHPPNYGSPYSNQPPQQEYHPLSGGGGGGSTSLSSSSSSSSTARTIAVTGRSSQQSRILNSQSADVPNAPPPYSMATLQVR